MALLSTTACAPTGSESAARPSPTPSPTATMVLPPGVTESPSADAADGPQTAPTLPTEEAAIGETVSFDTGISVDIASVKVIQVTAQTPGEVSGSAIAVTVTAKNDTDAEQSLESAVVSVTADDGQPGIGTTAGDPKPFSGTVKPGTSASGTYVFMLDPASDRSVNVSVNYAAGEPVAVFTGKAS